MRNNANVIRAWWLGVVWRRYGRHDRWSRFTTNLVARRKDLEFTYITNEKDRVIDAWWLSRTSHPVWFDKTLDYISNAENDKALAILNDFEDHGVNEGRVLEARVSVQDPWESVIVEQITPGTRTTKPTYRVRFMYPKKGLFADGSTIFTKSRSDIIPQNIELMRNKILHLNIGDFYILREMAKRIQSLWRGGSWLQLWNNIKKCVRLIQKVWRGHYRRCWFSEKMQTDIYPVIEAYQYKIGLWNRLARNVHLYFKTRLRIIVIVGESDEMSQVVAKKFVQDAFAMVFLCSNADTATGNEIAKEITSCGKGNCYFMETETDQIESVRAMSDNVMSQYGKIDVLVNNCANKGHPAEDGNVIDPEDDRMLISTNLITGPYLCFKACLPHMERNGGVVINICPYEDASAPQTIKASSIKTGLLALTHEVAASEKNIRVNAICPLIVMGDTQIRAPLRPGVARLAHFLASVECPFMSGHSMIAQGYLTTESYDNFKFRVEQRPRPVTIPEEELPPRIQSNEYQQKQITGPIESPANGELLLIGNGQGNIPPEEEGMKTPPAVIVDLKKYGSELQDQYLVFMRKHEAAKRKHARRSVKDAGTSLESRYEAPSELLQIEAENNNDDLTTNDSVSETSSVTKKKKPLYKRNISKGLSKRFQIRFNTKKDYVNGGQ